MKLYKYDITYKAFRGVWMTLTGTYLGRNKEEAIKLFKLKSTNGEIISICEIISIKRIDEYGRPTKLKV